METEKILIKFCDFISHLMGPQTEVVLHDRTGKILWITGGEITGRAVGQQEQPSAMEMIARQQAAEGSDFCTGYKSFSRKGRLCAPRRCFSGMRRVRWTMCCV